MGLLGSTLKFGLKSFLKSWSFFPTRVMWGAGLGAVEAYRRGYDRPEDIVKGAAIGAAGLGIVPTKAFLGLAGAAVLGTAGITGKYALKGTWRAAFGSGVLRTLDEMAARKKIIKPLFEYLGSKHSGLAGTAYGLTTGTAKWLLRHPTTTMMAGSGAFLYYRMFANPEESTSAVGQIYSHAGDIRERAQDLQNSTNGLVQGLHAGRHGGW